MGRTRASKLSIHNAKHYLCATVEKQAKTDTVPVTVLFPLFDVRVQTYDGGFMVLGYAISSDMQARVIRDVRLVLRAGGEANRSGHRIAALLQSKDAR